MSKLNKPKIKADWPDLGSRLFSFGTNSHVSDVHPDSKGRRLMELLHVLLMLVMHDLFIAVLCQVEKALACSGILTFLEIVGLCVIYQFNHMKNLLLSYPKKWAN